MEAAVRPAVLRPPAARACDSVLSAPREACLPEPPEDSEPPLPAGAAARDEPLRELAAREPLREPALPATAEQERARRRRALLRGRAAASVTRLPIFLIFACELLELGRGMARLERIVSLIVVSHAPSISAMPRGAPTSTAPPHQDRRRASKLLSRIREVVDNKGRYVCLSKTKEEIRELASRIFPVQKFQHKVSLVQLLTYRWFFVPDESISRQERNGTGAISRQPMPCGRFRSGGEDTPAAPRRARRTFTGKIGGTWFGGLLSCAFELGLQERARKSRHAGRES